MKHEIILLIILLLFTPVFANAPYDGPSYRNDLDEVVEHTRRMLQTSNKKAVAEWVTQVVDDRLLNSNSEEVFTAGSPFNFFTAPYNYYTRSRDLEEMRSSPFYDSYDDIARMAWKARLGNCGENSFVTYYILKKAGAEGHIRVLQSGKEGAHSFCVWGLPPDAITNDPTTCDDALVVDPWLGRVIDGEEAMENRWFKNGDPDVPIKDGTTQIDEEVEDWNTIWRNDARKRGRNPNNNPNKTDELEDCFIATAVYGTPMNEEIKLLRNYRDRELGNTFIGRLFIAGYETFGPLAAYYIRQDEKRKQWTREHIVEPALEFVNHQD
jgi:hypothetical protein